MNAVRIATRNSPLALWQANHVRDVLLKVHQGLAVELVPMTTRGDRLLDRNLATVGGKGLFLKELEEALLSNRADIAVHSMKDVPVGLPDNLEIISVMEREDPRDAFVSNRYQNLYALPEGSVVGTSSLRRVAQLKFAFPRIEFQELRGNVNTRLNKLDKGDFDGIILATAGLKRLDLHERIKQYISPALCLPAVGQGIVGIECRSDDEDIKRLMEPLNDKCSEIVYGAERALNIELQGGCQVPIGGYAEVEKGRLTMRAVVGEPDGSNLLSVNGSIDSISLGEAQQLGAKLATKLLDKGAGVILNSLSAKHLSDKPTVIMTRQYRYLGNMPAILHKLDFNAVHVPAIGIEATDQARKDLDMLDQYSDIVFVSRNAVAIGMQIINDLGGIPDSIRTMAVGVETAKQLHSQGVDVLFPNQGGGAKALLDVEELKDLSGRRILIVRGEQGLQWPAEEMQKRGAEVIEAICYRQVTPEFSPGRLNNVVQQVDVIAAVFAHSANALGNLVAMAGQADEALLQAELIAGSENIADAARQLNWQGEIRVASSPSNKDMMLAFSEHRE